MRISSHFTSFNMPVNNGNRIIASRDSAAKNPASKMILGEKATQETPLQKYLREAQASLKQLKPPSPKKQASGNLDQIKQRLESLKNMLKQIGSILTPTQAKALAQQLKSIAKELAAAAKTLDDSSVKFNVSMSDDEISEESADTSSGDASAELAAVEQAARQAEAEAGAKAAQTEKGADLTSETTKQPLSEKGTNAQNVSEGEKKGGTLPSPTGADNADSKALRFALAEASKLLKEVLGMIKAKLMADKEGRKDVTEIEKDMRDVERALFPANALYNLEGLETPVPDSVGLEANA